MKLPGHRNEQLRLLRDRGASMKSKAAAVMSDRRLRPVTLSRMVDEGLVEHAMLPFNGDSKRRASHYWLTKKGLEAAW